MSSLKKIIVIPSWYPTLESPYSGIFFKVQSEIFRQNTIYDVKVFPYNLTLIGRRKLAKKILTFDHFYKSVEAPLDVGLFEVPIKINVIAYSSKKYTEIKNIKSAYLKIISQYIKLGWKPDLIHVHDVHWGGVIARHLHDVLKIPYIITQHNPLFFNYVDDFMRREFIAAFAYAKQVLTVSTYDLRLLTAAKVNNHLQSVGNLINENIFTLKEVGTSNKKFMIYTVGSLSYRKDYYTLLKALNYLMYELREKDVEVIINYVNIFEDNFKLSELEDLIKFFSLENHCKLINKIPLDQMLKNYHNASIYIQTSTYETFGVAVVEALMCGTPVVATDNGGIQDIYDGKNMILKKNHDYIGVAEAIYAIKQKDVVFDSDDLRNSVINKFGTDAFKERIGNIYLNNLDTVQHD